METNSTLDIFSNSLFLYLTGKHPSQDEVNIFRRHNNKLDTCGDISFPLNISAWKKYIHTQESDVNIPIVNYASKLNQNILNLCDFAEMIENSKEWIVPIVKCSIENDKKLNIFLDRISTFKNVINSILLQGEKYGHQNISFPSSIDIRIENKNDDLTNMDLTELRINLLKDVAVNLLKNCGCSLDNSMNSDVIYLTNKSESSLESKKIVCGVVISNKFGKKNTSVSAEEFYSKRTVDMRLMAQHKYGVRVNSEPGWTDFFKQLGNAAVIVDLLHVKPSRPIVVNIDNPTSTYSKGASFILYNSARLATIFKQFNQKVQSGVYPPLPELDEIDFSLLNQPEEWEILYVYLMQFRRIVINCIKDIAECKLNTHYLCSFLDLMCALFSIYYRRVRILTEPRTHLFPIIFTRIYLLKAVQQVLHNALALLNIPPVKQM